VQNNMYRGARNVSEAKGGGSPVRLAEQTMNNPSPPAFLWNKRGISLC